MITRFNNRISRSCTSRRTWRTERGRGPGQGRLPVDRRRGVVGIVAMIFLVLFASLATTMAVVTQGNLRSSVSHMRVTRAISGIDAGIEISQSRLEEAASRFLVARGEITPQDATELWRGTYPAEPEVTVLPPAYGRVEPTPSNGIAQMLAQHHDADDPANLVLGVDSENVPAPIILPSAPDGWVVTPPIGLERSGDDLIVTATQITYVPPDALGRILVVVTGYNWDFTRERWVTRTAQMHFDMTKRVDHAIVAPTRVMIGRNVGVNGPLGVRYDSDALDSIDGSPLTLKSDFEGLDAGLDAKLADFLAVVLSDDTNGDNKLMIGHAVEGASLGMLNGEDYNGDSVPDGAFVDMTNDGAIDEFDIFLKHYDTNGDGRVVLSPALTLGTPAQGQSAEFTADDALAELIDGGKPDRNNNGLANGRFINGAWDYTTFRDNNNDGEIDSLDVDQNDVILGYRDGVLDYRDQYAKVRGSIAFRASRSQWEQMTDEFGVAIGDYQKFVRGPIDPEDPDELPVVFDADDTEVPDISPESFAAATQGLIDIAQANDLSFGQQVADQAGDGWTPPTLIEATPYGAPSPSDWYERPVYQDMTFRNVRIPMGNNGLFINCTFIGVTFVESYEDNTHPSWPFYGAQVRDAQSGSLEWQYPQSEESDIALDKSWVTPDVEGYDSLPDPLFVSVDLDGDGVQPDQCINTKLVANNIRFHNCLFVGSIVANRTQVFHNRRNKLQFTGSTRFVDKHPDAPDDPDLNPTDDEAVEISKSSMMLPNYSVDIGTNNSSPDQDVRLKGAIIAGVIDIRGNATIDGILLADFKPVYGVAPFDMYGTPVGNPADFNITIGYFGPEDGDEEGINISELEDLDGDGTLDIGYDTARDPDTGAMIPLEDVAGMDPADYPDTWFDGVIDTDADFVPGDWARRPIPFNGFGKIEINWNPNIALPDGLATPLSISPNMWSYVEGRVVIEAENDG